MELFTRVPSLVNITRNYHFRTTFKNWGGGGGGGGNITMRINRIMGELVGFFLILSGRGWEPTLQFKAALPWD